MAQYDVDSVVENLEDDQDQDLEGALQENVLTVLCFDEDAALLVRRLVEPKLFENEMYKRIAQAAFEYIDETGKPPADHLPDLLEEVIAKATDVRADAYKATLRMMRKAYKTINVEFVMSRLHDFVDTRRVKGAIVTAVKEVDAGRTDNAKEAMEVVLRAGADVFDPGVRFWLPQEALAFFDTKDEGLPLNIKPLDDAKIQPAPKELFTFIAPTGKGKTWFLLYVAKQAIVHRKKTVFISLEMSRERLSQRFIQAYFSYRKRKLRDAAGKSGDHIAGRRFLKETDKKPGRETVRDRTQRKLGRPTLDDAQARTDLAKLIREYGRRIPLIIQQFPPASLTMRELQAYLDSLDRLHHFRPEVVIVDYADLMQHDTNNLRIDLEHTYQQLRGLAIERNVAVVTASQANRLGGKDDTKLITLDRVAESIGKVNVADNVLTYTQSRIEQQQGLARLFVAKARNDVSNFTVVISQAYPIGQFCLDAIRMPGEQYGEYVDEIGAEQDA